MSRIFYILFVSVILFTSCDKDDDNDDLKAENQKLKEALANNSKIEKVDFSGTEMILTYSNGLKLKTSIPDALKGKKGDTPTIGGNGNWWIGDKDTGVKASGNDGLTPKIGQNGNWWIGNKDTGVSAQGVKGLDGVGIQSITFDNKTGIMTITLTNGKVSRFVVSSSGNSLSAVIMKDLNGKYLVKKVMMGDAPVAVVEYTADNKVRKSTTYRVDGYRTFKADDVEKEYIGGKLSKVIHRIYSRNDVTNYEDDHSVYSRLELFTEDKGYKFFENRNGKLWYFYNRNYTHKGYTYNKQLWLEKELDNKIIKNADNTYTVYDFDDNEIKDRKSYYSYDVYENCIVHESSETYSIKLADKKFKIYYPTYKSIVINGKEKYLLYPGKIRTITEVIKPGDLLETKISKISVNKGNKVEKVYKVSENGSPSKNYILMTYEGENKLIKSESVQFINGKYVKSKNYISYEYNAQNLLVQTKQHKEGKELVIGKVIYDKEGNPIEIFKYYGEIINTERNRNIDPTTGLCNDVIRKPGLYSALKVEYNYAMKNFFGHSLQFVSSELYNFDIKNAIRNIRISNDSRYGSVDYKHFNEGGYPELVTFLGSSKVGSYTGELSVEYQKIK